LFNTITGWHQTITVYYRNLTTQASQAWNRVATWNWTHIFRFNVLLDSVKMFVDVVDLLLSIVWHPKPTFS